MIRLFHHAIRVNLLLGFHLEKEHLQLVQKVFELNEIQQIERIIQLSYNRKE